MTLRLPRTELLQWRYATLAERLDLPFELYRSLCPLWAASGELDSDLPSLVSAGVRAALTLVGAGCLPGPALSNVGPRSEYVVCVARDIARANGARFALHPEDGLKLGELGRRELHHQVAALLEKSSSTAAGPTGAAVEPLVRARPRLYGASALSGFPSASDEWLRDHGVQVPAGADPLTRGRLALAAQRRINLRTAQPLRDLGLVVFLPQESSDPDLHTDRPNFEVHDDDYGEVVDSDGFILLGDFPAVGAGKELAWAEAIGAQVLSLTTPGVRASRLVSGTPTAPEFFAEEIASVDEFPEVTLRWVVGQLPALARHARLRHEGFGLSELQAALVKNSRGPASTAPITARALRQVLRSTSHLAASSVRELQAAASMQGMRVVMRLEPTGTLPSENATPERLAAWVLERAGSPRPPNIDLNAIARTVGIRRIGAAQNLDGDAMTVEEVPGRFRTFLRAGLSPVRARFTIAHEVAHLVIPGQLASTVHRDGPAADEGLERRCDQVAASVLMPSYWLGPRVGELQSAGLTPMATVDTIASEAGVARSTAAIALRGLLNNSWTLAALKRRSDGRWYVRRLWGDRATPTAPSSRFSKQSEVTLESLSGIGISKVFLQLKLGESAFSISGEISHPAGSRPDEYLMLITEWRPVA